MGNTAGGLPYPEVTAPVRDGATAIRSLADAIELRGGGKRIQAGRFQGTTQPTGIVLISFPVAFKAATSPTIVAWIGWGQPNAGAIFLMFENQAFGWGPAAFHVLVRNHDGTALGSMAIDVQYIAVGTA